MGKQRRHFNPEDKVKALRRHLVEKAPISDLCEELGIQPTQFYRWQQALFENTTTRWRAPRSVRTDSTSDQDSCVSPCVLRRLRFRYMAPPLAF